MTYAAEPEAEAMSRKSRNLDAEARCVSSTDAGDVRLVVEPLAR